MYLNEVLFLALQGKISDLKSENNFVLSGKRFVVLIYNTKKEIFFQGVSLIVCLRSENRMFSFEWPLFLMVSVFQNECMLKETSQFVTVLTEISWTDSHMFFTHEFPSKHLLPRVWVSKLQEQCLSADIFCIKLISVTKNHRISTEWLLLLPVQSHTKLLSLNK